MKLKYFMRGLGVGILFSAVILALSFYNKPKENLSKDEILERARKFGLMTEQEWEEEKLNKTLVNMTGQPATSGAVSAETGSEGAINDKVEGSKDSPDFVTSSNPPEGTGKPTGDTQSTDAPVSMTPSNPPAETDEPDKDKPEDDKTPLPSLLAVIEVKGGMVSSEVAEDLQMQGIIDDADDFDQYMCDNGFAPQIQVGTFYVPKGATYLEIAEILMGK